MIAKQIKSCSFNLMLHEKSTSRFYAQVTSIFLFCEMKINITLQDGIFE